MVVVNRRSTAPFAQERLAKEDVRLLIECLERAASEGVHIYNASPTRLELLIGKLKRMEKQ